MSRPVGGWLVVVGLSILASGCPSGGGGGGSKNDAPVAVDDVAVTSEETPVVVDVLANDTDDDADDLVFVVGFTEAANGTVFIDSDGTVIYEPDLDFSGSDTFTYTISDGRDTATANVAITVSTVGDSPVAVADAYAATEDTVLTVALATGVLANDDDVDTTGFTAVIDQNAADGTVALAADGSFTYTPDADFSGADAFTYHATDGTQSSSIVTVSIVVAAVNDMPVADADGAYTVAEDGVLTVNAATGVLDGDVDADGDDLDALAATQPANGSLALNADGSFTYTPNANFNGSDSFTYSARDGVVSSTPATVSLTVTAVNDAPVAAADSYAGTEDTTLSQAAPGVLANDSDADAGASLTAILVTGPPSASSFTLDTNGSFSYTPNANFNGTDSFTYHANDGSADSGDVTVTLTVSAVNDLPVANADAYSTNEDTALVVSAADGVLLGGSLGGVADTDLDGDALNALLVSAPSNGSLSLNADGSFTYTPNANYNGADAFTYRARDAVSNSGVATVSIAVNAVNDAPVANADSYAGTEDTPIVIAAAGVLGNDTDGDGQSLTVGLPRPIAAPSNGAVTLNADGSFTYTPNANFNGSDSFTYQATDGTAPSGTATVSLNVGAVNDPPSFTKGSNVTVNEDSGVFTQAGWATALSAGPADEVGQALSFEVIPVDPALFSVGPAVSAAGTLTFTPAANAFGVATVSVSLLDDGGTPGSTGDDRRSPPQLFSITISPVNDPPSFAIGGARTVAEDSGPYGEAAYAGGMSPGPLESEGVNFSTNNDNPGLFFDPFCLLPNCGQPWVDNSGRLTLQPAPDAFGSATVTVTLIDDFGAFTEQTFLLTVTPVNDPPSFTMGPDQSALDTGGPRTVFGWATNINVGPGEAGQGLSFSAVADSAGLFSTQPAIDAANGTLTYTPALGANGNALVTVVLTDDGGTPGVPADDASTSPRTFTIAVRPQNLPPSYLSSNVDNVLLSFDEAFGSGGALLPAIVTFDDPELDCAAMFVDVLRMEGGPMVEDTTMPFGDTGDYWRDCVPGSGQIRLFFNSFATDQDGTGMQINLSNVRDTIGNAGADKTLLFSYDAMAPSVVAAEGGCSANTRVIVQFNETVDEPLAVGTFFWTNQFTSMAVPLESGTPAFAATALPDDTFYAVPRDLLDVGGLFNYGANFADLAGNQYCPGCQFGLDTGCFNSGSAPTIDRVEFVTSGGTIVVTVPGTAIGGEGFLADNDLVGLNTDVRVVLSEDANFNFSQLRSQTDTPTGEFQVNGVTEGPRSIRFSPDDVVPGFTWGAGTSFSLDVGFCGFASGCGQEGHRFVVQRPAGTDTLAPTVIALAGRRTSGSRPILRPEEPILVSFSETVNPRTIDAANFSIESPLGQVFDVAVRRRDGGEGTYFEVRPVSPPLPSPTPTPPFPLPAPRARLALPVDAGYRLVISGVTDVADPPLVLNAVKDFDVDVAPGAAAMQLDSSPDNLDLDVDAGPFGPAASIHVVFSDAISAQSLIDTGTGPRGFRLEESWGSPSGPLIPLKGLGPQSDLFNGPRTLAEPEVATLVALPSLQVLREDRRYVLTPLPGLRNADGEPVDSPSLASFEFRTAGPGILTRPPVLQETGASLQQFPGTFTFGGMPLANETRVSACFQDSFSNPGPWTVRIVTATSSQSLSSGNTCGDSFQIGALGTDALFPLPGATDFEVSVTDPDVRVSSLSGRAWRFDDGAAVLPHGVLTALTPIVTQVTPGIFRFSGGVSAASFPADAGAIHTIDVLVVLVDAFNPDDLIDFAYSAATQISRDASGNLTYDHVMPPDEVLPLADAHPNCPTAACEYRVVGIASAPAPVGFGGGGSSAISEASGVFSP